MPQAYIFFGVLYNKHQSSGSQIEVASQPRHQTESSILVRQNF